MTRMGIQRLIGRIAAGDQPHPALDGDRQARPLTRVIVWLNQRQLLNALRMNHEADADASLEAYVEELQATLAQLYPETSATVELIGLGCDLGLRQ